MIIVLPDDTVYYIKKKTMLGIGYLSMSHFSRIARPQNRAYYCSDGHHNLMERKHC